MENLKNQINQIITECAAENGFQLYHLSNENHTNQSDESGIDTYSWTGNFDDFDDLLELDKKIGKRITEELNPEGYTVTSEEGLHKQWGTESDDFIRLHYSDHSIHLICFQSGQY